ncbi:hypothetical protein BT96DRAFT_583303 [Gymnopus androsaceus JB14]|uniref:F-box domain-containing protein n=1 Tax=Gymnopus androsaceus JB14 TaxID=1447944 RepID=A0A6A4IKY0_9AGAR|nr:hypothetical protein BT96DRAFT_583303 [Gymnopus androsaceus JB14]
MNTTVLLHARPYARFPSALILVPLLAPPKQLTLPTEIWTQIFEMMELGDRSSHLSAMLVCKNFKDIVQPLLYSHVSFSRYSSLESFCKRIHDADSRWDSLRRIPFSAPGRWVQSLDVSRLELRKPTKHRLYEDPFDNTEILALRVDSLLTNLFPLLPFLSVFSMNPTFSFSRRACISLTERHGVGKLRSLRGIYYVPSHGMPRDPLLDLLQNCPNLEELEVIGPDIDPLEHDTTYLWYDGQVLPLDLPAMCLPKLQVLTLLACLQASPLMLSLLSTSLPSLTKLTITPFHDIPSSTSSLFIASHGETLRSLLLLSRRKSWPSHLYTSPTNILQTSPNLRHLSLEVPLPAIELTEEHSLEILSIPKPSLDSWALISRLLPHLPSLKAVRIRDVKWLRKGMGPRAMETGVQGEMREWRRRLARRGVRILDSEWKDADSV